MLGNLLKLLPRFRGTFWCTDGYRAYKETLPSEKPILGKLYTQRIEHENLRLRNQFKHINRKTLGYSKSSDMHDKIIATFIKQGY